MSSEKKHETETQREKNRLTRLFTSHHTTLKTFTMVTNISIKMPTVIVNVIKSKIDFFLHFLK